MSNFSWTNQVLDTLKMLAVGEQYDVDSMRMRDVVVPKTDPFRHPTSQDKADWIVREMGATSYRVQFVHELQTYRFRRMS